MHTEFRHGALTVVEEVRSSDWVVKELRKIDDRLFVERQVTYDNEMVWCVVCDVGLGHPPITILEWRDESGRPLPELSSGIVTRIERMERDGARLSEKVTRANMERIDAGRRKANDAWSEIARDMVPRISETRSALLPRGQHLRRSRDKQRSKGWNV